MSTQTPTDPNAVIEEIKAVLVKHNVAGLVMVQSPERMAFLHHLCPTWTCCKQQQTPLGLELRVKINAALYPDPKERKKVIEDTTGMMFAFRSQLERSLDAMDMLCGTMEAAIGTVTHVENHEQPEGEEHGQN